MEVAVGQQVKIICLVDSNPPSGVSWQNGKAKRMTPESVNEQKAVLYFKEAQLNDSGVYFCSATNERGQSTRNISLSVNGSLKFEADMSLTDSSNTLGIVAGVIGVVIAVVIFVAVIALWRTWKKKSTTCSTTKSTDGQHRNNEQENRIHTEDTERAKSNTEQPSNEIEEYAIVIPKSQRQRQETVDTPLRKVLSDKASNHLVYAELDLESPGVATVFKRTAEEPVEYVELDFKNKDRLT